MSMHTLKEIFYDILDAASAAPEVSMQQDIKALLPVNGNGANKNVVIINNQNVSINNVTSLAVKGLREVEAREINSDMQLYENITPALPQGDPMVALAEYCYTVKLDWREAQEKFRQAYITYAFKESGKTADVATRLKMSVPQVSNLKKKYKLPKQQ